MENIFHLKKAAFIFCALTSCYNSTASSQQDDYSVTATVSTEFNPMSSSWYTNPWPESDIPRRLEQLTPSVITQLGQTSGTLLEVDPSTTYQTLLGLGASLEHTTVYAIRKNKTAEQQKEVLRSLIDPVQGMGMNFFRVSIGTSDFADGTRAIPAPDNAKGWYSYQDTPTSPFSIARDESLGIIETIRMAVEVGVETNNELKILASPWSPPRWMREGDNMVDGGPLKADMLDDYAAYLRKFVEAYQAEGIPIYALSMQNERQFEPGAYPGMVITWQMERDLLIEVYENFHNIDGNYGPELDVKLWTLDHNFDYWQQAKLQLDSFKAMGKDHYVDATAFHHYGGVSENMGQLHDAHPDKDVVFTEGTIWGLSSDGNKRSYEALIRHFRNWATGYLSWVTMTTQTLNEANQGPYNGLGAFDPTLLVKYDGDNANWYKTPEYWLMSQFSKYLKPGALRIESNYGSLQTVTNVAFLNPDGYVVLIVANSTNGVQQFDVISEGNQFNASVPARSIATYRWKAGLGQSPHSWQAPPELPQFPYAENSIEIPGLVEAEHYDLGGAGAAYADVSTGNNGGVLRADDVDIEANANGYHIGWLDAGEWLEYSVNVNQGQSFDVLIASASASSGGQFHFEVNGESVSPILVTPATGGWKTFVSTLHRGLQLNAGEQVLRLVIDGGEFNIDSFHIVPAGSMEPPVQEDICEEATVSILAGKIQAESYCLASGIQTENTSDQGGGENIGWIDAGDSVDYGVSVANAGSYTLNLRVASQNGGGEIALSVGDTVLANVQIPGTGGWQNWQTISVPVQLSAGYQQLHFVFINGGLNINWFEFVETDNPTDPTDPTDPAAELEEGAYYIINEASGKALDVSGVSTSNGTNVQQWSYSGGLNQQWIAQHVSGNTFELVSLNSGSCLDADNGSDNAHQWACEGNTNQQWVIEGQSDGTYLIRTKAGNEVLEVQGGSANNGANVRTASSVNNNRQKWRFNDVE
ncbi:carbohydrate-binding protein [Saccharophagus degradans]|uniref:Putative retaining b-glycosidase n=1 Tax=Saccharophagus degradans (strain 2-40 / ATCC 43961 / DSM 17024) TaxID=203122 RepID=Q21GD0_SACD2|nr:carbohydrate-binding protein [Saccharophagus degradans]ABD82249.1 putative retaining b-glycosidase [Saccharophagus degradans 2-40]